MNTPNRCFLALLLLLAVARPWLPATPVTGPHKNEITQIDLAAGTVSIYNDRGEAKVYRITAGTQILVNNQKGTLKDLAPGMAAQVTTSAPGVAERLVILSKTAPASSRLRVPASASPDNPIAVGTVKAGQVVTVVPIKVWWCGGGSKTRVFCDWNGYKGTKASGFPWMALIAAVGKDAVAPTNNILTFTVLTDGTLVLYPNDGKPDDNSGTGDVTVTVTDK